MSNTYNLVAPKVKVCLCYSTCQTGLENTYNVRGESGYRKEAPFGYLSRDKKKLYR